MKDIIWDKDGKCSDCVFVDEGSLVLCDRCNDECSDNHGCYKFKTHRRPCENMDEGKKFLYKYVGDNIGFITHINDEGYVCTGVPKVEGVKTFKEIFEIDNKIGIEE